MELPKKKENENKINCLNEYIKYNENLTVFEGSTGRLKVIGHLPKFEKNIYHMEIKCHYDTE